MYIIIITMNRIYYNTATLACKTLKNVTLDMLKSWPQLLISPFPFLPLLSSEGQCTIPLGFSYARGKINSHVHVL